MIGNDTLSRSLHPQVDALGRTRVASRAPAVHGVSIEDPRMAAAVGARAAAARLEHWQIELCHRADLLARWCDEHGSPINLIHPAPMERNAGELIDAASGHGIDLRIFFARKANKALALVDEARRLGLGVDLASERELEQALARGVAAARSRHDRGGQAGRACSGSVPRRARRW